MLYTCCHGSKLIICVFNSVNRLEIIETQLAIIETQLSNLVIHVKTILNKVGSIYILMPEDTTVNIINRSHLSVPPWEVEDKRSIL